MKSSHVKTKKSGKSLAINIAPENWRVTGPVNIKICQQPAKIIPWPMLPPLRLPRLDVWQLDELFPAPNQQLF